MANQWLILVKKHSKAVAAEKKAGKFKGNSMKEAIKRAKAEYSKVKGEDKAKPEKKEDEEESKEEEDK